MSYLYDAIAAIAAAIEGETLTTATIGGHDLPDALTHRPDCLPPRDPSEIQATDCRHFWLELSSSEENPRNHGYSDEDGLTDLSIGLTIGYYGIATHRLYVEAVALEDVDILAHELPHQLSAGGISWPTAQGFGAALLAVEGATLQRDDEGRGGMLLTATIGLKYQRTF